MALEEHIDEKMKDGAAYDSTGGLPVWDFTRVPEGKISENTRIMVELETIDQVWCRPDASLACKADGFPPEPLTDGFQTVCATPGDDASNGWMSVPLSEMVKGGYSQQVQRHNEKALYRNTAAKKSAEWLLCTKKGSWAFCDSETKKATQTERCGVSQLRRATYRPYHAPDGVFLRIDSPWEGGRH